MSCEDFQGQMLAGVDSSDLRTHLASCETCQKAQPALAEGATMLNDEAMWLPPSEELEDKIIDMLVSDGAAGSDEGIPRGDEAPPPALHAVDDLPEPGARRRNTPNVWALLGVAAVIVAAFLIFATGRPDPDWSVQVAGGPAAPTATAIVDGWNTDSGTRLLVQMRGLEDAPDGFFYELWMSKGPLHISGGTFTGTTDVELWAGVTRGDFPRIWITLEPIDEDESPSGEVVLDTGRQA